MNHPLGFPFIYSFLLNKPFHTQNLFWDVSEEYVGSRLHHIVFTYPISLISYLKFPPFASSWLLSYKNLSSQCPLNPFHATGLFRYPMKTSENLRKPLVLWLRGYRKRPVAWNWLMQFFLGNNIPMDVSS